MGRQQKKDSMVKCGETRFEGDSGGGGGMCENPVGLSIFDVPVETAEYIWVSIRCMLDWISSQNCRNTLPLLTISHCLALGVQKTRPCCRWWG